MFKVSWPVLVREMMLFLRSALSSVIITKLRFVIFPIKELFFSSRRRHTRWTGYWSSDVCSSDLGLRLPPAVKAEVELVPVADREGVVVEGIVIRKRDGGPDGHHRHRRHEGLVRDRDLELSGGGRGGGPAVQPHHRVPQVRGRLVVLFEDRHPPGDGPGGGARHDGLGGAIGPEEAARGGQQAHPTPHASESLSREGRSAYCKHRKTARSPP